VTELQPHMNEKVLAILAGLDDISLVPSQDRRQAARVPFRHEMETLLLGGSSDARVKVHTRNLSRRGLGFLSRRPFRSGDYLVLAFTIAGSTGKIVLGRVTFARYISGALHYIGVEFQKALPNPSGKLAIPTEWANLAHNPATLPA
jgi:hypothetical protein